jgi:hypothetical protein
MLTEVKYRTFDELLDSIRIDMHLHEAEGFIEPQQLIKVARNVNYELGLKVNPSREKLIELHRGKAKLPLDFYVLNFAVICQGKKSWDAAMETDSKIREDLLIAKINELEDMVAQKNLPTYSVTQTINDGNTIINHNLGTTDVIVQLHKDGEPNYAFEYVKLDANRVLITSEVAITGVRVIVVGIPQQLPGVINPEGCVTTEWSPSGLKVVKKTYSNITTYDHPVLMQIEPSKAVAPECMNGHIPSPYRGALKNGFLDTNLDEGTIYINYQSLMEDDDGNLLVMDQERVNEYYEYAIKRRILENMLMSGENVGAQLQLIEARYREARNNALSFINTPDFNEMKRTWELNRRAQTNKYVDMFKSQINHGSKRFI